MSWDAQRGSRAGAVCGPYYPPMTLAPMDELGCSKRLQSWRCIRPLAPSGNISTSGSMWTSMLSQSRFSCNQTHTHYKKIAKFINKNIFVQTSLKYFLKINSNRGTYKNKDKLCSKKEYCFLNSMSSFCDNKLIKGLRLNSGKWFFSFDFNSV